MMKLVIIAAIVAAITHPVHGYDTNANGGHRVVPPSKHATVAWVIVCVSMVAGPVVHGFFQ